MKTIKLISLLSGSALLLLLNFTNLSAQDSATKTAVKPHETYNLTLQHTTLVVSNFEESRKFYIEILGLQDMNADWLPEKQMFISLGKNLELHMGEVPGIDINPSSFNHFAISTNDLEGYLQYLNSHGIYNSSLGGAVKGEVFKRPDGVSQTFIQDPDGYWIEINDAN